MIFLTPFEKDVEQPILFQVPEHKPDYFVAVFTSEEKIQSWPVAPYIFGGNTRWTELVQRDTALTDKQLTGVFRRRAANSS